MTSKTADRKKLLKRLKGFRKLNAASIDSLDPDLVARLDNTILALEAPVQVAIAGLSDARHHSVAEMIGGAALVSPDTNIAACPSLLLRTGAEQTTSAHVAGRDRAFRGSVIDKLISLRVDTTIELNLPTMRLPHVELTVLPVYDGHEDQSSYLLDLIESNDAVIWCTNASTPWHSRERRLWFTVPDDLKARSILALTGADAIDGDVEAFSTYQEKCEIAGENFVSMVPLSQMGVSLTEDSQTLLGSLGNVIDGTIVQDALALRSELDTIPIGTTQAVPDPVPAPAAAPASDGVSTPPALRDRIGEQARACADLAEAGTGDEAPAVFDAMTELLSTIATALSDGTRLTRDHDALAAELAEATDLVTLLGYEGTPEAVGEAADLVRQITVDVLDRLPEAQADAGFQDEYREAS